MRMKMTGKLLLPFLGVIAVGVIGSGLVSGVIASHALQERMSQELADKAATAKRSMDSWLNDRVSDLDGISHLPSAITSADDVNARAALSGQLSAIAKAHTFYQAICFLDLQGTIVASSDPGRMGKNMGDRAYFKQAKEGREVISEVLVSKVTGRPFFTVACPVRNAAGAVTGVIYAPVEMSAFNGLFLDHLVSDTSDLAFLLGADGKIIAHRDTSLVLKKSAADLPYGKNLASADSIVKFSCDHSSYLAGRVQLEDGWSLWIVENLAHQNAMLRSMNVGIWLFTLFALALATIIVLLSMRPVVRALKEAYGFAVKVGEGDTRTRLTVGRTDEIGELMGSLNRMADSLMERAALANRIADRDLTAEILPNSEHDTLGTALAGMQANLRQILASVKTGAVATSSSAEELDALSRSMASAAEQTAAQASEVGRLSEEVTRNVSSVSSATEEMGVSINEISHNATDAAQTSTRAVELAGAAQQTVGSLADASEEIGKIVTTIQGIATQTNLLALNATIEAARAGEAGKGFAVVASEVKELSQGSAQASEEIRRRIETIRAEISSAGTAITAVTEIIGKIADYSRSIAGAVEEQTATTSEISRSLAEAAGGVSDISNAIAGVSQAAQSSAEAASGTRTASDRLTGFAEDLTRKVDAFKLP